ncbi:MAG: polyphenol oxidase [Thiomicrorhabdus sp.]|nr:MAG: polyphenol oxidase [Thiomicrorhabdus sp.]
MFILPNWPAPAHIKSYATTRQGGVSQLPYDTFNLALHVGDNPHDVATNRQRLTELAHLPSEPFWLDQQHTDHAIQLINFVPERGIKVGGGIPPLADASWTTKENLVSLVMTADCLPILITNQSGTVVSAIHAGWKGLQKGIVSKTIAEFRGKEGCQPEQLMAWIGPAISVKHFEVGQDVLDAFVLRDIANRDFFMPIEGKEGKYLADLPGIVTKELNGLGVSAVYGGDHCTYDDEQFFSYRRSGRTGRIASFIWIEPL